MPDKTRERWVYPSTGFYSGCPHRAVIKQLPTRWWRRRPWYFIIERRFVNWQLAGVGKRYFASEAEAVAAANGALDHIAAEPDGRVVLIEEGQADG